MNMPTTKFKITENTKRTLLKINGVPVVVNQEYDIALQSGISIYNSSGVPAEPLDSFKYKIIVDDVTSVNEAKVTVNFETDKTITTPIVNAGKTMTIGDSFFFSTIVSGKTSYDRIVIFQIIGQGSWLFNGLPLVVGQVIFYYQLVNNLKFIANEDEPKEAYNILKWRFANIEFTEPNQSTITINTTAVFTPEPQP